jgi:hypothetical protein
VARKLTGPDVEADGDRNPGGCENSQIDMSWLPLRHGADIIKSAGLSRLYLIGVYAAGPQAIAKRLDSNSSSSTPSPRVRGRSKQDPNS